MSEPFLAEIKIVAFTFAPRNWAFCDGQLLPINQYQSLYSLLGTTYGGDGRTTFQLPDLRGRAPMHIGSNGTSSYSLGDRVGTEGVALTTDQIPAHTHVMQGTDVDATGPIPTDNVFAHATTNVYHTPANLTPLHTEAVGQTGTGAAHNNMMPYLTLSFCIALAGLFPSRN